MADFSGAGAAGGALSGAATGAAVGSVVPVIGTGIGAIGGAIIGGVAGGFAGGGDADADFDLARQPIGGFLPGSDPLLAQLQQLGLLGIGGDPSQISGQGSPVLRFLNAPVSGALGNQFTGDFNTTVFTNAGTAISDEVARGIAAGVDDAQIIQTIRNRIGPTFAGFQENAAVAAGFSNFDDLVRSQIDFERKQPEEAERARKQLDIVRAGQDATTQGISQLLQDFPVPTQSAIDELAGTFAEETRRNRLQQANVLGSPADLRGIENDSLLRSLTQFGGQQQLAGNALSAFRGDQTQALLNALAPQQQGQAAQLSSANLAGSQASAFSNINAQTELANLEAQQQRQSDLLNIFGTAAGGSLEFLAAQQKGPAATPSGGSPAGNAKLLELLELSGRN